MDLLCCHSVSLTIHVIKFCAFLRVYLSSLSHSTETLATMIKQLLPETLQYLQETNTKCTGALYSSWADQQVYGMTETRCFLNLLSALLERNAPKVETALTHTGTGSRLSSGRWSESRASSAVLSTYR